MDELFPSGYCASCQKHVQKCDCPQIPILPETKIQCRDCERDLDSDNIYGQCSECYNKEIKRSNT